MAGHHHHPVREDRALQKLYQYRENAGNYFQFTKKTAIGNLIYVVAIPGIFGYLAYKLEGEVDLTAQRRTSPLWDAKEYEPRV